MKEKYRVRGVITSIYLENNQVSLIVDEGQLIDAGEPITYYYDPKIESSLSKCFEDETKVTFWVSVNDDDEETVYRVT